MDTFAPSLRRPSQSVSRTARASRGLPEGPYVARHRHEDHPSRHSRTPVYSKRALASFRKVGDQWGEGWALYNLGKIHQKLGDLPAAIGSLRHVLNVFGDIGNRMGEGVTLAVLGTLLMRTDRAHEAPDCLRQALSIFEDLGAPRAADLRARLKDT